MSRDRGKIEHLHGPLRSFHENGRDDAFPEGEESFGSVHLSHAIHDGGVGMHVSRHGLGLKLESSLHHVQRLHHAHFHEPFSSQK